MTPRKSTSRLDKEKGDVQPRGESGKVVHDLAGRMPNPLVLRRLQLPVQHPLDVGWAARIRNIQIGAGRHLYSLASQYSQLPLVGWYGHSYRGLQV